MNQNAINKLNDRISYLEAHLEALQLEVKLLTKEIRKQNKTTD